MTASGRDRKGRFTRTLEGAERDAEACRMHARGAPFQRIADELGYGHRSNARRAVLTHLEGIIQPAAAVARAAALERLGVVRERVWEVMNREHITVSHGKVIMIEGPDGREQPLVDDAPILAAADRLVKIEQVQADLEGTKAPTKVQSEGTVHYTVEGIDVAALR
jgi:hypothetical protein